MATTDWVTITADDLNDYMVAAQVDAMQAKALAAGQADPFDTVMPDIVARVRKKIEACPGNQLDEDANTIPPSMKWVACWLVIEAMQMRLGLPLKDDQRTILTDAKKYLDGVAKCDIPVETPPDPGESDAQTNAGPMTVITTTTTARKVTRAKMNGLT